MELTELLNNSLQNQSLLAFFFSFLGGILASFTPCVYPILPVTVAFIGGLSKGKRMASIIYSFLYVLGIAVVYSGLGAFAALTGKMFGQWASSPWGYIVIGNVCLIFALSFFDLFEINFSFIKGGNINVKSAGIMAFITGGVAGLTVSACTAPILAVLLTYVGQNQDVLYGIGLLFSFSLGFGILILLCGVFSGILSSLPKAGKWMLWTKRFFGIILILMAEYYFITAGKNWY